MVATVKTQKKASATMANLFFAGFILSVIGAVIAAAASPETKISAFGEATKSGSEGGFFFGLFLSGVGGCMLWVALVAYGVMLGSRASRND